VYGWVESANAFNTQGTDIGLFGISGAAEADGVTGLASLICMQLGELTCGCGAALPPCPPPPPPPFCGLFSMLLF
jgi:hypothetical protein